MTYRQLLRALKRLSPEQLNTTVTIHTVDDEKYFAAHQIDITDPHSDTDVLDPNHPVIIVDPTVTCADPNMPWPPRPALDPLTWICLK